MIDILAVMCVIQFVWFLITLSFQMKRNELVETKICDLVDFVVNDRHRIKEVEAKLLLIKYYKEQENEEMKKFTQGFAYRPPVKTKHAKTNNLKLIRK